MDPPRGARLQDRRAARYAVPVAVDAYETEKRELERIAAARGEVEREALGMLVMRHEDFDAAATALAEHDARGVPLVGEPYE